MASWAVTADPPLFLPHFFTPSIRSPPLDSRLVSFSTKGFPSTRYPKAAFWIKKYRERSFKVRAGGTSAGGSRPVAPLKFQSPTGQLLAQIMQSHPHLLPATIDQQLEQLQSDEEAQKKEASHAPQDLLYKRIAELKDKERQKALEEIIYCLIVQRFIVNEISMIPAIDSTLDSSSPIDSWPNQEDKLEKAHSADAFEMIQNHLTLVLGERAVGPLTTIVQISKLKLGKLYAASIMYGYFLKRIDERYQLEKNMNTLPRRTKQQPVFENLKPNPFWDLESMVQISSDEDGSDGDDDQSNSNRLRSYVAYLDADTIQTYATMRSKEAISLIEKQTQALFGRPDIKVADDGTLGALNDQVISITCSGLAMLVLEAAAFGSFLWEAEGYVESKYHFLKS